MPEAPNHTPSLNRVKVKKEEGGFQEGEVSFLVVKSI